MTTDIHKALQRVWHELTWETEEWGYCQGLQCNYGQYMYGGKPVDIMTNSRGKIQRVHDAACIWREVATALDISFEGGGS